MMFSFVRLQKQARITAILELVEGRSSGPD